ncbi:MAG: hypothetical protein PUG48_00555 [Clostridia bacterium]|nr:hypothetical protein [Clostridia bacterium]
MKKLFRRSLSTVLSLSMIASMTTVGITSVSAVSETKSKPLIAVNGVSETESKPLTAINAVSEKTAEKKGEYSLDEIYTDYLFPHTGKSSEVKNTEPIKNTVANANDDKTYADFNFTTVSSSEEESSSETSSKEESSSETSSKEESSSETSSEEESSSDTPETMQEKAENIANDTSTDNPLAGYTFVRPEELLIGQINKNNQHKGEIRAIDNVELPVNKLDTIGSLENAGNTISLSESNKGQTHNAIGIDYNGDNIDELAYFSLYADKKGYASVRTYKRSTSGGTLSWTQVSDQNIQISNNNKLLDMEAQQSKGYTAMTAGDFDNDGKEELACYFPCANNGNGEPFVGIIDIGDNGNFNISNMKKIYLSSIRSDLKKLQSGKDSFESWFMPVVALSTTSIRANGEENQEKSYDDLVINVSIPRVYHDNNANMNSCIAIYSYNKGKYEQKFQSDLRYDTIRMLSTNSVDADLNGDGYNELVVAGMKEYGLSGDKHTNKISTSENLVQLIYWDGSNYKFVLDTPVKVTASGQVKVDWNAQEPIAITAGRYNINTPATMDYLCIQGIVLSCKNSKVYGVEKVAPDDTDSGKAIIDTLPYKDKELFKNAYFHTEYKTNIRKLCNAKNNAFISTATSGMFYVAGKTETIALLTGDEREGHTDDISYDIILLFYDDEEGKWQSKAYDDYIHFKNEDDQGTYMSMCFVDCDSDQMYYKYREKTVGYSSPTLYAVIQAPPFYKENNSADVSYTITHETKKGIKHSGGVGLGIGLGYEGKTFGANGSLLIKYIGSKTTTTSYSKSTTLTLSTDQDYAVSFVIPVIISTYDVWIPNGNNGKGKWDEMVTTQYLDPAFAALPIDKYNELANSLKDDRREAAPVINKLPASSSGDPYGYNSTSDALIKAMSIKSDKILETEVMVSTDTKSTSNSIGVTKSTEKTNGINIVFDANIKKAIVNIKVSADYSASWINSNSNGVSFSVTYTALKKSNPVQINTNNQGLYQYDDFMDLEGKWINNNIVHYQPADYRYKAHAVAYPSKNLTVNGKSVYLLSYYTDNRSKTTPPPELPEYFGVQSVSKKKDGNYSVTLAWKNKVRNSNRKPDAYNIYLKTINGNTVDLVNNEGPIDFNANKDIMTYKVNVSEDDISNDCVFYIAAANKENVSGTITVKESILSTPVTVNIDKLLKTDGVVIIKQPKNCYVKNTGDKASFSVEAYDSKREVKKLSYQWQTYDSSAKKWINVTNHKFSYPNIYEFDTTPDSFGKPIRCIVKKKKKSSVVSYIATTNAVTVIKGEKPKTPDAFDKDENDNFIIKTYDDLVKLSELVRTDYEDYGTQNYILENNIKAPDDSVWIQGIGCVSDDKAFNGTFNGNGYCIIDLNVKSSEYGGLFEAIGEKGTVKDLFVFDCDFISSSKVAGGIAAVNKGTIDHCVSGVNFTSGVLILSDKTIDLVSLNSNIKGDLSGGIVGENSGTITGCCNSAVVSGTQCGGIASVNTGKIYGCANGIRIGTSSSTISGGLVGKNGGTIESSYNSVTVNGKSGNSKGSIAGINGYDGLTPTVKNVYYITSGSLNAVGTDSKNTPDNTNTAMSKISDFQNDDFKNKMNAVCDDDDTVVWVRNDHFNNGFPVIKLDFLKLLSKSAGNNITVQGSMHNDLNISYSDLNENSEEYATLVSSVKDKILKAYSVSLTNNDGNYIPTELWCQNSCIISVPVDKDNVQLVGIDTDGQIAYFKPDSVENGIAAFTVPHPMSFAIVETASNNNNTNSDNPKNSNTTVPTGETTYVAVYLLVAMLSLVVIFIVKRRKRIR